MCCQIKDLFLSVVSSQIRSSTTPLQKYGPIRTYHKGTTASLLRTPGSQSAMSPLAWPRPPLVRTWWRAGLPVREPMTAMLLRPISWRSSSNSSLPCSTVNRSASRSSSCSSYNTTSNNSCYSISISSRYGSNYKSHKPSTTQVTQHSCLNLYRVHLKPFCSKATAALVYSGTTVHGRVLQSSSDWAKTNWFKIMKLK